MGDDPTTFDLSGFRWGTVLAITNRFQRCLAILREIGQKPLYRTECA
jgi:hypothetical protein